MPTTLFWFRIYCALLTIIYLACIAGGVALAVLQPDESLEFPEGFSLIYGVILAGMGLVFAIVFAIGTFLPRKRWAWIYGLILICIGMTSALFLPICIPLLIFWLKDPMKEWFGRKLP